MLESMHNLMRDALNNNSFDYKSMHNTLKNTWYSSFSYLYGKQKAFVEYEELFYYSNDETSRNSKLIGKLHLDTKTRPTFEVEYDLINICNREEFRRSRFYLNEFSFLDIVDNPNIFLKMPVILIDDEVIWDYKLKVTHDSTTIILPFKRDFVIKNERNPENDWDIIYLDHKIQILIVDNIYYKRIVLNRSNSLFNEEEKTISISKEYLGNDYPNEKTGIPFCSIHIPNSVDREYELGSMLLELKDIGDYLVGKLPLSVTDKISSAVSDFYVSISFFNYLHKHTFYNGNDFTYTSDGINANLMVIEKSERKPYEMPIPVEDFILFKRGITEDIPHIIHNSDNLEMFYPNIYRVCDNEMKPYDTYEIYYFYYPNDDLKYTPVHEFYYAYLSHHFTMSVEEIIDKTYRNVIDYPDWNEHQILEFRQTFFKILRYHYYHYQYAEVDFLYRYKVLPGNEYEHDEPWEYKDSTIRNWIMVEPDTLRNYVLDQNKLGDSYHLFTNSIDLSKRIRTSTAIEMNDPNAPSFNEERYVFAMANTRDYPLLLDCRIFVDGLIVEDLIQERRAFMDYFYIPVNLVTDDSYIEIEVFPTYEFQQELIFTSVDETKTITIAEPDENIFPTIADMYYLDKSVVPRQRYDSNFFNITACYNEGDFAVETVDKDKPVRFTRLNKFIIQPKKGSVEVLNKPITLTFSKKPNAMEILIDRPGYPYLEFVEKFWNFSVEYLRIFLNGRLLPREKYAFFSTFECPRIQIMEFCDKGDILYFDVTPYRYTQIYYQKELEPGRTIIDLKGIINKPFDIRYYDVYMNGRKLSLNNVFSIDPWSITLVNLKSKYNLTIYEKERDYEFFGLDYTKRIYYFSKEDLLNEEYISEEEKNEFIKCIIDRSKDPGLNIYPNTNEEDPQDYTDITRYVRIYVFYYDEVIAKNYMNPDLLQFASKIIEEDYSDINEVYRIKPSDESRFLVEERRRRNYPDVIRLNPDITIAGGHPENEPYSIVMSVGHIDEVEDNILNERIEMKYTYPINHKEV